MMQSFRVYSNSWLATLLVCAVVGHAQTAPSASVPDPQFLDTMIKAGAYAEAFTQFCENANRTEIPRDQAQLAAWVARNHWAAIQGRLNADPSLQAKFSTEKKSFNAEFAAHRFKTAFACGLLPQQLASPAHDPSRTYASELQALDGVPSTGSLASVTPPSTSAPSVPAAPVTPDANTSRPDSASPAPRYASPQAQPSSASFVNPKTGEVDGIPRGAPITVGAVTFTPPAGWRPGENSANRAILQAATQHTKAVLMVQQLPLSGDFGSAFASALRSQMPIANLKLQYPHQGSTGAGSPMIQILDSGTLRNGRERAKLDAVGIALGDSMILATLLSGDWGGDQYSFQRAFEKMVSAWRLTGERGTPWDPLHPPSPVGARSGLFLGSRVENALNPLGGMDLKAVREYLVLLPTGQAFQALPQGGHVLDMDFAAECTRLPNACGTYQIHGNTIDFTWREEYGIVTHQTSQLKSNSSGNVSVESFKGTSAVEMKPVRDCRISGRYTSTFAQVGSTAFQSTSVVSQTFIAFSPDGSYQKSGFSGASFSGTGASGTVNSHKGIQSGRYTFDGYALTLTPSEGNPPETFTTIVETVSSTPAAIFIEDTAFLRDRK
jgi:hypothetical protein